jgi:hypothetical protein
MKELAVIGEFKEMLQIFQRDWMLIERMPYSDQKGRREAMLEWRLSVTFTLRRRRKSFL